MNHNSINLREKIEQNARNKGLFLTNDDIEAYARGDLDEQTKAILEARMERDPAFAADVNAELAIAEGIRLYAKQMNIGIETRAAIAPDKQEEPEVTTIPSAEMPAAMKVVVSNEQKNNGNTKVVLMPPSPFKYRNWLVAAALALVLGAVLFFKHQPNEQIQSLVQIEIKSLQSKTEQTSQGFSSSEFDKANYLTNMGKFKEVQKELLKIPKDRLSYELRYLLGMALLYEGQYADALPNFEENITEPYMPVDYLAKSIYGAALCQLGLHDKNKAIKYLDKIISMTPGSQEYVEKSQSLKIQLKK